MRILYLDVDTLRADHLGCHGYHRATTPTIDALAAEGVRFTNVYASDVPCLPSRTALVTGMFGIRNGVVNHGGATADLRSWGHRRGFFDPWRPAVVGHRRCYLAGWHTASLSSFPLRHSALVVEQRVHGGDEPHARLRSRAGRPGAAGRARLARPAGSRPTAGSSTSTSGTPTPRTTPPTTTGTRSPPTRCRPGSPRRCGPRHWDLAGPHSAQEPWGFTPRRVG